MCMYNLLKNPFYSINNITLLYIFMIKKKKNIIIKHNKNEKKFNNLLNS